ncbi:hypothetical protein HanXRQr2_Chr05g0237841 [Helianthus annuus]|uniref:Uncharacterized protein n=1 Tax=Helianthus annuus TaxID=4232 RepID=A0A9K3NPB5_HELAN|nr:hypothetical protein HanXRQr2_Chr05g0237841 [Helianthus annuus]KAJ0924554.1 hypothetical protein HanPSC8_Chr05g0229441 [Helianthus annuus]
MRTRTNSEKEPIESHPSSSNSVLLLLYIRISTMTRLAVHWLASVRMTTI